MHQGDGMKFSSKNKQEVWTSESQIRFKVSLLLKDVSIQNNTDFKKARTLVWPAVNNQEVCSETFVNMFIGGARISADAVMDTKCSQIVTI